MSDECVVNVEGSLEFACMLMCGVDLGRRIQAGGGGRSVHGL